MNPGPIGFRLDDAWIHQVYARNFFSDGFLSYNNGIPSTGCTSPLWVFCLSFIYLFLGKGSAVDTLVFAAYGLGVIFYCLVVWRSTCLTFELTQNRFAAITGGIMIALATPLAAGSYSGMEISLTCLMLILAVHTYVKEKWYLSGLFWSLAFLSRPESLAVFGVGVILLIVFSKDRWKACFKIALPVIGIIFLYMLYNYWASGLPLPATYYAKKSFSLGDLPIRFYKAFKLQLSQVPPFLFHTIWLLLIGYLPFRKFTLRFPSVEFPMIAGIVFLIANIALISPDDPIAFYHLRYLLPAVPLLIIGLTIGVFLLGLELGKKYKRATVLLLVFVLMISFFQAMVTIKKVSAHMHNDVRNINEVQRKIGEWMHYSIPRGTWIAASDAGAVRYFSELPTIDVMGLNTPEMLRKNERFIKEHPVSAFVYIPEWFEPIEKDIFQGRYYENTERYSVTANWKMNIQWVGVVFKTPSNKPVRIHFKGKSNLALYFLPYPGN